MFSEQFLRMHIQTVHKCAFHVHTLPNTHPMCTVYGMHIDWLSRAYFTLFKVKRFHQQLKPHLESRESENQLCINLLNTQTTKKTEEVHFQRCEYYWLTEVRLPKWGLCLSPTAKNTQPKAKCCGFKTDKGAKLKVLHLSLEFPSKVVGVMETSKHPEPQSGMSGCVEMRGERPDVSQHPLESGPSAPNTA